MKLAKIKINYNKIFTMIASKSNSKYLYSLNFIFYNISLTNNLGI